MTKSLVLYSGDMQGISGSGVMCEVGPEPSTKHMCGNGCKANGDSYE